MAEAYKVDTTLVVNNLHWPTRGPINSGLAPRYASVECAKRRPDTMVTSTRCLLFCPRCRCWCCCCCCCRCCCCYSSTAQIEGCCSLVSIRCSLCNTAGPLSCRVNECEVITGPTLAIVVLRVQLLCGSFFRLPVNVQLIETEKTTCRTRI